MQDDKHQRRTGKSFLTFLAGAVTALAAAGYLLYGPGGRHRRDEIERRIEDVQADLLERMARLRDVTSSAYDRLVDEVLEDYAVAKDITSAQARRMSARLKARYKQMRELARESARQARREAEDLEEE